MLAQIVMLTILFNSGIPICSISALPPVGQTGSSATRDWKETCALTVGGVGLNTSYDQVLRRLGTPITTSTRSDAFFGPHAKIRTLVYRGLKVELMNSAHSGAFEVTRLTVTSRRWRVAPGIRVGMTRDATIAVLGAASDQETQAGSELLWYSCSSMDARVRVTLKAERVVSIEWEFDLS